MWPWLVSAALGAGFASGDPGAAAIGRGGAWVATADDPLAVWWNPGALADQPIAWRADLGAVLARGRFDDGNTVGTGFGVAPIPRAAGVVRIPGDLRLGLAVGPPMDAPAWRWTAAGPQRYGVINETIAALDGAAALARRFGPVDVGGAFVASGLAVDQSLAATTAFGGGVDPAYDVITRVRAVDLFAPVEIVGVRATAGPVRVGASFRSAARYRAHGRLDADFSANAFYTGASDLGAIIAQPTASSRGVTVPIVLPAIARAGIALSPRPATIVEADLAWEGWSSLRELSVQDVDLAIPTVGGGDLIVDEDVNVPLGLDDTWSVRVGAESEDAAARSWRAGASYTTAASPSRYRTALVPDAPHVGAAVGVALPVDGWTIDLAVAPRIALGRPIARSSFAQVAIDPMTGRVGFGQAVGAGTLRSWDVDVVVGIGRRRDR